MKTRRCLACGQALPSWARIDKLTCTGACRTRLCRQRKDARNTFVTGTKAVAPRSDAGVSNQPFRSLDDIPGARGQLGLWLSAEGAR
jgi:predicted nucleic acid-binding Zn ribbon protein